MVGGAADGVPFFARIGFRKVNRSSPGECFDGIRGRIFPGIFPPVDPHAVRTAEVGRLEFGATRSGERGFSAINRPLVIDPKGLIFLVHKGAAWTNRTAE